MLRPIRITRQFTKTPASSVLWHQGETTSTAPPHQMLDLAVLGCQQIMQAQSTALQTPSTRAT